jgi:hypothetical protein
VEKSGPAVYPVTDHTAVWSEVAPMLQKALSRSNGEIWLEDVEAMLARGEMQMLVIVIEDEIVAVLILVAVNYPRKRALRLAIAAGRNLHDWVDVAEEAVYDYAQQLGVDLLEIEGRLGWAKIFKSRDESTRLYSVKLTRKL